MCESGDEILVRVPIPARLSYTGDFRWEQKRIDACLAPLITELNLFGFWTAGCCCGHGIGEGSIILHDGQKLTVAEARRLLDSEVDRRIERLRIRIGEMLREHIKPNSFRFD